MHARALQFLTDGGWRQGQGHPARAAAVLAAVVVLAILGGCRGRELTLTDLSKTVRLAPPGPGDKVVGMLLDTELDAPAPVQMNIGCAGVVEARVTVPRGRFKQRIDWYSACTELSFPAGRAGARSLTIRYRFQTL